MWMPKNKPIFSISWHDSFLFEEVCLRLLKSRDWGAGLLSNSGSVVTLDILDSFEEEANFCSGISKGLHLPDEVNENKTLGTNLHIRWIVIHECEFSGGVNNQIRKVSGEVFTYVSQFLALTSRIIHFMIRSRLWWLVALPPINGSMNWEAWVSSLRIEQMWLESMVSCIIWRMGDLLRFFEQTFDGDRYPRPFELYPTT